MEETLIAILTGSAPVTALCGNRIQWSLSPQGRQLPAVVLHRITGIRDYHMQGPSGLVQSRVQVDCWATSYREAVELSRAVRGVLSGLAEQGIQGTFIETEWQSVEKPPDSSERLHRVSLDFNLWHDE